MSKKSRGEEAALAVLKRLRSHGHEAYFAGGCVRDLLMGKLPEDYDIASSARPEEVERLFRRVISIGARFGSVAVLEKGVQVEVTTFRSEGKYSDGRRPDQVSYADARSDVTRRDFTINAMLYDPATGEVLDFVGGRADLRDRLVRAVGVPRDRFEEDRLRLLRAVRFAAKLDFTIEPRTAEALLSLAPRITSVSSERIRNELERMLTDAGREAGFRLLGEYGLLPHILPEVASLRGRPCASCGAGDLLDHAARTLGQLRNPSFELALASLLHEGGGPPAEVAARVCQRLRTSNSERDKVVWLIQRFPDMRVASQMPMSELRLLLANEFFEELAELYRACVVAGNGDLSNYEFCRETLARLGRSGVAPPSLLTGHDLIRLGLEPGPIFSELIADVRRRQLDGQLKTKEDALSWVWKKVQKEHNPDKL